MNWWCRIYVVSNYPKTLFRCQTHVEPPADGGGVGHSGLANVEGESLGRVGKRYRPFSRRVSHAMPSESEIVVSVEPSAMNAERGRGATRNVPIDLWRGGRGQRGASVTSGKKRTPRQTTAMRALEVSGIQKANPARRRVSSLPASSISNWLTSHKEEKGHDGESGEEEGAASKGIDGPNGGGGEDPVEGAKAEGGSLMRRRREGRRKMRCNVSRARDQDEQKKRTNAEISSNPAWRNTVEE